MSEKKNRYWERLIVALLIPVIVVGLPLIYSLTLKNNWGCGYEYLSWHTIKIYFIAYFTIIYLSILFVIRPDFLGAISILGMIGVLAAIVIPNTLRYQAEPYDCEMKWNMASLYNAEQKYFAKNGKYSENFAELGWRPKRMKNYCYFLSETESVAAPNFKDCKLDKGAKPFALNKTFLIASVGKIHYSKVIDVWSINEKKELKNIVDDVKL